MSSEARIHAFSEEIVLIPRRMIVFANGLARTGKFLTKLSMEQGHVV